MKNRSGLATVPQAVAAFLGALATVVAIGVFISQTGLPIEFAILATPAATLLVAVGAVRLFRLRPTGALQLRPAKNIHLLLSVPAALALFVVSDQLSSLSQQLVPVDEETLRALAEMVRADGWVSWMVLIGGVGFGAAISEELLFRGVIVTGLAGRLGRGMAILLSALMFTVMHGLMLPNYFVAGAVLGYVALTTRSILVPISIHFFHNLTALLLFNLADLETLGDPIWIPAGILVPAGAILGISLWIYGRDATGKKRRQPAASAAPVGAGSETWLPPPPPGTLAVGPELRTVPPRKRRLGLMILAGGLLGGLGITTGLFVLLGYLANPGPHRAAAIETMRRISMESLAESAGARGAEVEAAFESLTELNREGRVGLGGIWQAARVVTEAARDGDFGDGDVDRLLMTVGAIRSEAPERPPPTD